jgi:farnesyl diphosphate synthase
MSAGGDFSECLQMPEMSFAAWMSAVQSGVERDLARFLPSTQTIPNRLHEAMRYATLDGGKRVRPLLVFAAGALFDAPADTLARAACAVEMIHAYSLVHDDMPCMDDDALRRGKPTVHKQYDEATALLVGDALQAQAFSVLAEGDAPPALRLEQVRILAQAAGSTGMCGGQAIDLDSVGERLTLAQLEQMHQLKTGALLRASVLMGAVAGAGAGAGKDHAAGLSPAQTEALSAYAKAIGLAFQVVDDVLDVTADSATLGKTAGKDAEQNKPTYVSILGLEPSKLLAEQLRQAAHAALQPFGAQAQRLRELADLIVQRKA